MYLVFSHMLKSFDREDLETLYKLVKAKYESTRPVEDLDLVLYEDLKTIFDPHVEDQVWKNQSDYRVLEWKLYDSCGVHSLRKKNVHIHMLVEKRYPLTAPTITDMLNKKLKLSMKKLEILKKNIKFRGGLLGLKDFLMILELPLIRSVLDNLANCLEVLAALRNSLEDVGTLHRAYEKSRDETEKGTSSSSNSPPDPFIIKYARKEAKRTIHFDLQPVTNEYLKWRGLLAGEKNAYNESLAKLQTRGIRVPRLVDCNIFEEYNCKDDLRELMKIEYTYDDGDVFMDYSWENVFPMVRKFIRNDVWSFI
ncbi:hypothetical protein Tco_0277336 [Tanacetum coccineum]